MIMYVLEDILVNGICLEVFPLDSNSLNIILHCLILQFESYNKIGCSFDILDKNNIQYHYFLDISHIYLI